ncbi:hypothetical protein DJ62_3852 [Yersinia enterocolitica]|nr:hypothetical protein DJ62_3852 [Yersinia enterocolitica]
MCSTLKALTSVVGAFIILGPAAVMSNKNRRMYGGQVGVT